MGLGWGKSWLRRNGRRTRTLIILYTVLLGFDISLEQNYTVKHIIWPLLGGCKDWITTTFLIPLIKFWIILKNFFFAETYPFKLNILKLFLYGSLDGGNIGLKYGNSSNWPYIEHRARDLSTQLSCFFTVGLSILGTKITEIVFVAL